MSSHGGVVFLIVVGVVHVSVFVYLPPSVWWTLLMLIRYQKCVSICIYKSETLIFFVTVKEELTFLTHMFLIKLPYSKYHWRKPCMQGFSRIKKEKHTPKAKKHTIDESTFAMQASHGLKGPQSGLNRLTSVQSPTKSTRAHLSATWLKGSRLEVGLGGLSCQFGRTDLAFPLIHLARVISRMLLQVG